MHRVRHPILSLLPLIALALPMTIRAQEAASKSAAQASNAFACDLYKVLATGQDNLFFSPYSISAALAMTRVGAAGRTAEQMDKVLHTAGLDVAIGHRTLAKDLTPRMVKDGYERGAKLLPVYELCIANQLWGQKGFDFEQKFLKTLDTEFGAALERVDFRETAKVRAQINKWVAESTKDKIKDIVPEGLPSPDTRLALGNAIYFKAAWVEAFEKQWTKPTPFTTLTGDTVQTPMMHRVDQFRYTADGDAQIVEIPYRGGDASMLVVLPKKGRKLADVEAKLRAEQIDSWRGAMKPARVRVHLPRFEFTSSFTLEQQLAMLGMKDAVDAERADFSGMTKEERLFIGAVLHKAFVAVDEAGTEAAAATVVLMLTGAAPADEPVLFLADRPFLFFIQHKKTGCVLFAGRVAEPGISKPPAKDKPAKDEPAKDEKESPKSTPPGGRRR